MNWVCALLLTAVGAHIAINVLMKLIAYSFLFYRDFRTSYLTKTNRTALDYGDLLKALNPWGTKDDLMNFYIGTSERLAALAILIFAPKQIALFVGGWIALKIAAYWERFDGSEHAHQNLLALLGNLLSFAAAIWIAWLIDPSFLSMMNTSE